MAFFSSSSVPILKRLISGTILEFGPILLFLGSFQHFHIYKATMFLMIGTIISTILTYRIQKRLPYLTLAHHEPKFIQMRDSLYDLTCAVTLLVGMMINIQFLKVAFHEVIPMTNKAWQRLTYFWVGYLLSAVVLNEFVRRTYSLHEWFDFKSGMLVATTVFGFLALYLCYQRPMTSAAK